MTTLLIDADILVYVAAATSEQRIDWGDGVTRETEGEDVAYGKLLQRVESLQDASGATRSVLCVTPASIVNWRLALWPTYKAHRKPQLKPLLVEALRARVIADGGYARPGLEADDILGVLATHPKIIPGRKLIYSTDKDLLQIPGEHFRWAKGGQPCVFEVSPGDADLWHLSQTLTGDATDGYPGLPGCGPTRADAILACPPDERWASIVAAFEARGLTEGDALIQARVARILRHTEYNFETKEPILWTPPKCAPAASASTVAAGTRRALPARKTAPRGATPPGGSTSTPRRPTP